MTSYLIIVIETIDRRVNLQTEFLNYILLFRNLSLQNVSRIEICHLLLCIFSMYNTHSDIWVVSLTQSSHLQDTFLSSPLTGCIPQ